MKGTSIRTISFAVIGKGVIMWPARSITCIQVIRKMLSSNSFGIALNVHVHIIQIWHLGECNINFYCTLKNDIARGACAECNIIFQSAIQIDIAQNQSAIFVLLYSYCSFKSNNLLI